MLHTIQFTTIILAAISILVWLQMMYNILKSLARDTSIYKNKRTKTEEAIFNMLEYCCELKEEQRKAKRDRWIAERRIKQLEFRELYTNVERENY